METPKLITTEWNGNTPTGGAQDPSLHQRILREQLEYSWRLELWTVSLRFHNLTRPRSIGCGLRPFWLIDAKGRTFARGGNALIDEGSAFLLTEINPGVSSRGTVVYDIPFGSY